MPVPSSSLSRSWLFLLLTTAVLLSLTGCASARKERALLHQACLAGLRTPGSGLPGEWLDGVWTPLDTIDINGYGVSRPTFPLRKPLTDLDQAFEVGLDLKSNVPPHTLRLLLHPATHEAREFTVQPDVNAGFLFHLTTRLPHSPNNFPAPYVDLPEHPGRWTVSVKAACGTGTLELTLKRGAISETWHTWDPALWQLTFRQSWTLAAPRSSMDSRTGTFTRVLAGPWPALTYATSQASNEAP